MLSKPLEQESKIIYNRQKIAVVSPFNPPKTATYLFEGENLNGNVEWQKVLKGILEAQSVTLKGLSTQLGTQEATLRPILEDNDTQHLDFKTGAKLLALEERYTHQSAVLSS